MIGFALFVLLAAAPHLTHENIQFKQHRSGTIAEIQSVALVVESARKERLTINISGVTIIYRNGRDTELDALRVGDRVVINVIPNDAGQLEAVMVRAQAAPMRKKAPAKSAPH